jgi:uncharacterized protein (TIGR00290 family)
MKRILLSWSSGKDSARALHLLRQHGEYEVVALLTTINAAADRVAMHGVRRELLEAQAAAAQLPLWTLSLPWPCANADYEAVMDGACRRAVAEGVYGVAFGDLFLEDVRAYRERQLAGTGLQPLFPLWGISTEELAHEMIRSGLRARLTCVDTQALPAEFAGREFDEQLLSDFRDLRRRRIGQPGNQAIGQPIEIDACGERGEFHTFCYAGPVFAQPIPVTSGGVVMRERFAFADLLPARQSTLA